MLKLYSTLTKKFYDESERNTALAAEDAIRKQYFKHQRKAPSEKDACDAQKKGCETEVKMYSNGKEITDEEKKFLILEKFFAEMRDFERCFNSLFRPF